MTFTVSGDMIFSTVLVAINALGWLWTLAKREARLAHRIDSVERAVALVEKALVGHAEKADKIGPIETELNSLKHQIGIEFKNLREDLRDMGRALQAMAMEMAKARAHTT